MHTWRAIPTCCRPPGNTYVVANSVKLSIEFDGAGNSSGDWFSQDLPSMPCLENTLDGCGLMPLDLIAFAIKQKDNGAEITWKAVHDPTCKSVNLEHSLDLETWTMTHAWTPVGPAFDNGNFKHANIGSGMHYYRLLTEYSDGASEYSEIANLHLCFDENRLLVLPNPTYGVADVILMTMDEITDVEYLLVDAQGNLRISKIGPGKLQIDLTLLFEGVYFLRIPDLGIVSRVVKVR